MSPITNSAYPLIYDGESFPENYISNRTKTTRKAQLREETEERTHSEDRTTLLQLLYNIHHLSYNRTLAFIPRRIYIKRSNTTSNPYLIKKTSQINLWLRKIILWQYIRSARHTHLAQKFQWQPQIYNNSAQYLKDGLWCSAEFIINAYWNSYQAWVTTQMISI